MPTIKVTVIYPAGTSFGMKVSKAEHKQQLLDLNPTDTIMTVEIPTTGDDKKDLETLFRYMNHVDGSPCEDQLNAFECRSMSVGDYAILPNGKSYLCAMVGFVEAPLPARTA